LILYYASSCASTVNEIVTTGSTCFFKKEERTRKDDRGRHQSLASERFQAA
jgi:hypothetical protein